MSKQELDESSKAGTLDNKNPVKVFVSYSHADSVWLKRLQVHLKPLQRDYKIDIWDDTMLKPGSKWKDEIREAVNTTNVAILIISADFIASDFIATNELPPLLKAAEEEGALILPIIASPSLFNRNQNLSQFQSVNPPSKPLLSLSDGEQEEVFLRVAEAVLDKAETSEEPLERISEIPMNGKSENFLDHSVWTRLVKIGDWIYDEGAEKILGSGIQAYLLSRKEYGKEHFSIMAELIFANIEKYTRQPSQDMNAGIVFGWMEEKVNPRYYHLMFSGKVLLLERVGFNGGDVFSDFEHLTKGIPYIVQEGVQYIVKISVASTIDISVDDRQLLSIERPTGVYGRVGLRPWRSQMECTKFTIQETVSAKQQD